MPKVTSRLVVELAEAAKRLSANDRAQLVRLLHLQGTAPPSFELLANALRFVGITPISFAAFEPQRRGRITAVCELLEDALRRVDGLRRRQAVVDTIMRQAKAFIVARGGAAHLNAILSVLETKPLGELLDAAFPGYPEELIGVVLCREKLARGVPSTGTQSSRKTASPTAPEGPM